MCKFIANESETRNINSIKLIRREGKYLRIYFYEGVIWSFHRGVIALHEAIDMFLKETYSDESLFSADMFHEAYLSDIREEVEEVEEVGSFSHFSPN